MSNNPITKWIKSSLESSEDIDAKLEDHVASMSIKGVKNTEERRTNVVYSGHCRDNHIIRPFDHFYIADSTLKAHVGGITSSPSAREFYIDLGEKKRERMIAKFKSESKE